MHCIPIAALALGKGIKSMRKANDNREEISTDVSFSSAAISA